MLAGRNLVALMICLQALGCGDDPPTSASDSGTSSTGVSTTTTAPPVPTTGAPSSSDEISGTGTTTASSTPTTTDPISTDTATGTDTTVTTLTTATSTGAPETTGTSTTDSSSGSTTAESTSSDTTEPGTTTSATITTEPGESSSTGGCASPADCPSPPNDCAVATCTQGECGVADAPLGTPCDGGVCDDAGACNDCNVDGDCVAPQICTDNTCVNPPPSCIDNLKNGSETDIDCGGSCPKCPDGDACLIDSDCQSNACDDNTCGVPLPLCAQQAPDPATGQRCPLFMPCTDSSECGILQGCQQWFCNNAKTCELNALVNCWTDVGGACNANVVFTQQTLPPVAKRFVPPDGVNFREVASLVFTVKNNTATDLYLDKLPLTLDVMGGASKFDVSSIKIFDNSGGSEHGGGDLLVCLTANPFSFPANGVMGPCGGSAFSRVPKNGGTNQFLVNVAFAADKTFINGRSYRLRLTGTAGVEFKNGFNGPLFAGTTCGVPNDGYTGAWVTAQTP